MNNTFSTLYLHFNDAAFKLSYTVTKILTDEDLFDLKDKCSITQQPKKIAVFLNRSKKSLQNRGLDTLIRKTNDMDITPKPAAGVAMELAKDTVLLLNKIGPQLAKSANSPLGIGVTVVAWAAFIFVDDTTRTLVTEQMNQLFALFQNENGKTKPINTATETKTLVTPTVEAPYKRPHYYL